MMAIRVKRTDTKMKTTTGKNSSKLFMEESQSENQRELYAANRYSYVVFTKTSQGCQALSPPQKKFISFLNSSLSVPVWEEKGTPMQPIAPYLVLLFFPLRYFLTQNILFLTLAKRRILSNNSKRGVYKKTGRCACCRLRQREEQQ